MKGNQRTTTTCESIAAAAADYNRQTTAKAIGEWVHMSLLQLCAVGDGMMYTNTVVCSSAATNINMDLRQQEEALQSDQQQQQQQQHVAYLKKLAYESVSFPNKTDILIASMGKPHDVEVRAAVKYYYREAHNSYRLKNKCTVPSSCTTCNDDATIACTGGDCDDNVNSNKRRRSKKKNQDDSINVKNVQIEITSDLGLSRQIRSPAELGKLLALSMEQTNNNAGDRFADNIRSDSNGIICIVTKDRALALRAAGRLPCPICIKWGKGEKGLWWHQQREHGSEHSVAASSAASLADDSLSIVVYNPHHYSCWPDEASLCAGRIEESSTNIGMDGFQLIRDGDLLKLQKMVDQGKFDPVNAQDRNGSSPVLWAAGSGDLNILRYLIQTCNCDSEQVQNGKRSFALRTPLHWAARNGHIRAVQFLVETCNVSIDAMTKDGTTAFCWACWQGHLPVMKYLHESGCNVHVTNNFGCNAVQWAAQGEVDIEGMSFLSSVNCDFFLVNSNGHGVVHKAAQRGNAVLCEWLFSEGNFLFDVRHVGPDTEQLCPSDLAGIEGYGDLAAWLATKEIALARSAFEKKREKGNSFVVPDWLQTCINGEREAADRARQNYLKARYYEERWEPMGAMKRMVYSIIASTP